jgi:hypothetical protein
MSRLPPAPPASSREWALQTEIQNVVIGLLWDSLPHPPTTYVPSMMLEMKVPTYVGGARVGAGGEMAVSEGRIGKIGAGVCPDPDVTRATVEGAAQTSLPTPPSSVFISPSNGYVNGLPTSARTTQPPPSIAQSPLPQRPYSSAFRNPSGAGNNPHLPLLGAAGTAYARSVVPLHAIPPSVLPDAGMVFDLLMKRRPAPRGADPAFAESGHPAYDPALARKFRGQGHGLPHPSGLNSLLFAFGDLIIHSLFRTSSKDDGVNLTSSYLDLSVLYGVDELEMGTVRRGDGTGRLWEDCWADPRIAMMSPAVGALLVIFCRNHNVRVGFYSV